MLRCIFSSKSTQCFSVQCSRRLSNDSTKFSEDWTVHEAEIRDLRELEPPPPYHRHAPYLSDLYELCTDLPSRTRICICGGGSVGIALAYHCAKLGLGRDTLLIEQGRLGGAVSWRGSGFLGGVKTSKAEMSIHRSSLLSVQKLHEEGHSVGWKQTGSLHLARTKQRLTYFRKLKALAEARGTECYILSAEETAERCSIITTHDLTGSLWVPKDGICDPYKTCLTLFKLAMDGGVKVVENCSARRVLTQDCRVVGVETSKGAVECDVFVNAGGIWARSIGQLSEPFVKVPIHPAEHYFLYTYPLKETDLSMPAIRDPDGNIYMREYNGGVLAGSFEKFAQPTFEDGVLPETCNGREQEPDWDHFHPALREILHRLPILSYAILSRLHNSADGFSPDCKWIIGQAPEYLNYFVAAGMKSGGSFTALGAGEMLAEWIANDHPPMDAYHLDILRFLPAHNNRKFLRDRVREVPGKHYSLNYPFSSFETGRCLRMSPIFNRLKSAGAVFGEVMGYERPSYFVGSESVRDSDSEAPFTMASTTTWTKPDWFRHTAREYQACREASGLLDYSSFAKFDVWSKGTEVVTALQYLCSNEVDIPIGGICHTGMQNKYGGYENDCSLARISPNHYMMIAPSIQQTRCLTWMKKNLPSDGSVVISDVTSMYTAICLIGPKAKNVLSELTDTDLSTKTFPFFSFKEIDVGLANGIRAMNLTHTGELGWVLYIPNEFALHVHDRLVEAGQKHGLRHAGYYAMRSLRIEKFYAFWGQDLDSTTTPLECGRVFRTKLHKDIDFLGRAALEHQQKVGVRRLYVHLTLEDHDPEVDLWPWGGEPIYRNGRFVGVTTTTGYGYTVQKLVCLGFIRNPDRNGNFDSVTPEYVMNGMYEVDIAGIRYSSNVSLRSPKLPSKFPDTSKDRYEATRN